MTPTQPSGERERLIEALINRGLAIEGPELKMILDLIDQYTASELIDKLGKLKDEYQRSYDNSGKGSRPKFSKDNETPGEYYSRGQGFKSAMLVAKRKIDEAIAELKAAQSGLEEK